jgi:MoaA/NifB/PqqE/SkfB family radical SAM enzyme
MNELPENKVSKIMFTGGEPLLVNNIVEYIKIASSHGLIVDLNSNLTLLDEGSAEEISKVGIAEVTTSLDGDEETHCRIRGNKDCFKRTLKSIELLRNKSINVDIVCMVMKSNIEKLSEVVSLTTDLGVSSITFSGLILAGRASKSELDIDLVELKTKIHDLRKKSEIPIRTVRLFNDDFSTCHKGVDMVSVDYLGDIHPCLQSKMENPMNIASCSLKEGIAHMRANIPTGGCE